MGKFDKSKTKHRFRHNPLAEEIFESTYAKPSSRDKNRRKFHEDDQFVDCKLTPGILRQAKQQQRDLEPKTRSSEPSFPHLGSDVEEDGQDEFSINENSNISEEIEVELANINEDDERAIKKFMTKDSQQKAVLKDIIKEKLTEKRTEITTIFSDAGSVSSHLDDQKLQQFKALVPVLKDYRSGRLPKAFKAIPRFSDWEIILCTTEPDKWSAATMYQATRMFSSNLQDKMAQRFYNLFLLPRLRDDIAECRTLNPHLYQALKKALYKPAAFFKGIIIPLVQSGNCTLREATIFGSVLAKCSIPVLHSSATLVAIAELDYTGVNSVFMRILLEKKYALPYRVVNAVVDHFLKFMTDCREFPLLWHQCLLTFIQTYKTDISPEQKANLRKLITIHRHEKVTSEIRRELDEEIDLVEAMQQVWKI